VIPFRPSATRIELFVQCPRRWAWGELYSEKSPATEAQEVGTAMHAQIEHYLRDGRPFDLTLEVHGIRVGEMALAGLQHLPKPKTPGMLVEQPFDSKLGGMPFQGTIDLTWATHPEVVDHKTTAGMGWAKTAEDLAVSIQPVTYAAEVMSWHGETWCDLRWIYYSKPKPHRSMVVPTRVHLSVIQPTIDFAAHALEAMHDIAERHLDPLALPPNAESCNAFGKPCPYVSRCNLTADQKWASLMAQTREEFLAGIKKQRAAAGGAAPAVNPPAVNAPPPGGAVVAPPPGAVAAPPPVTVHPWQSPGVVFHPAGTTVGAGATHYRQAHETTWTDAPSSAPPPAVAPPSTGIVDATPPPKKRGRPKSTPAPEVPKDADGDEDPIDLLMQASELLGRACAILAEDAGE
jgi:hypothetical protein